MRFIIYVLAYPILWSISMLPFWLLYLVSDMVYFVVYYLIAYRKITVRKNLIIAFPDLSEKERLRIEKKSFQHLCDMFLEMIKTLSISKKEIEKRFVFSNLEVYQELEKKDKSIAMMVAHYASYEWVISMNAYVNYSAFAIYKKINNPYFDKLVRNIRSKFKASLITSKESISVIAGNHRTKKLSIYGFAGDQTPKITSAYHWYPFMGTMVPVHTGAEVLSKKYNMNVIFLKVTKVKRGHYSASFEIISENAKAVANYEITDAFFRLVEAQIREAPEYYLWTHKRWKHKQPTTN